MNKLIILALASLLSLTGCGDEKVMSKSFYMKNDTARLEKLKFCDDNPDKENLSQNCTNAHAARGQLAMDKLNGEGIVIDYSKAAKKTK